MPVAVLYDIHANLPALEAVLQEIRSAAVDQIVIGGDVLPGPMPRETIELLLSLEIPTQFIHGNGDRAVLSAITDRPLDPMPEQAREAVRWVAGQLSSGHEQLLAAWPDTLHLQVEGLDEVLFCHATPRGDTEIFTRLTPEDRLVPLFQQLEAPVVVCGHTHMQFDRLIGGVRVLNAGSVGMPFGEPGAYWLLLGPGIQFRHTAYDFANATERIRETSYPQAADFAARNILNPPSEQEMLAVFARVEIH
jgi:putative phosphoesterase